MRAISALGPIGIGVLMFAHTGFAEASPQTDEERKVAAIAEEHLAVKAPYFDRKSLPLVIIDRGNEWEVTYKLPPTSLGGTPHVFVDKNTYRVTRLRQEQ